MVSIIMTYYNTPEDKLQTAIQSVLSQTYKDIELILVNDCCEVSGCLDRLIALWQDNRGNTIHHIINAENQGHSESMNVGMRNANGEYYYFMDSDDIIHPKAISYLLSQMRFCKADIGVGGYTRNQDELGKDSSETTVISKERAISEICAWSDSRYFKSQNRFYLNSTWNSLYKKELFNGIEFPKGKTRDNHFTLHKIFWNADKIMITSFISYYYRADGGLAGNKIYQNKDLILACQERLQFLTDVVKDGDCIENEKCWLLYDSIKIYEQLKDDEILEQIKDMEVNSPYLMDYKEKILKERNEQI